MPDITADALYDIHERHRHAHLRVGGGSCAVLQPAQFPTDPDDGANGGNITMTGSAPSSSGTTGGTAP